MSFIIEITGCVLIIGMILFFYKYFYKNYGVKERYVALYELWKINELLEARGLSLKALDEFELRLIAEEKNAIVAIDEHYKREKAELKKGK